MDYLIENVMRSKKKDISSAQIEFDYTPAPSPKKGSAPARESKSKSAKAPDSDPASYIDSQYSGAKADLRPLYEKLINLAMKLGKDIRVCPGKTIVPIYRKNVIAQVKPATNTRIDLGLALGKQKATGRLIDTGGYARGDRITHRIPISTRADIDSEVEKWLKMAYESDGGKK
jgi:hypothetical protein